MLFPLLSISLALDAIFVLIQGVLRGMGKQYYGILMTISGMIVSLPISIVLTMVYGMGVWGYWLGLACGSLVSVICFCYVDYLLQTQVYESRVETPFVSDESTQSVHDSDVNIEESIVIENGLNIHDNYARISYGKIVLFISLLLLLVLDLGCKFSEDKFVIHFNKTYFKAPINFCCFQLTQ